MNGRLRQLNPKIAVALVVLITLIVFAPVVTFEFTSWDDFETIARNPKLNPPTIQSFKSFWTRPYMDLYMPVTQTVWGVTAMVARNPEPLGPERISLSPFTFHALNLILHACAAAMVFIVLHRLFGNSIGAMCGALLFALHPVQVEAVAWTSGTKDLLCGLLSLIALWQYLKFTAAVNVRIRRRHFAVATIAFMLAMLSKPTAIVLPFVVATIDLLILRRPLRDVAKALWPWVALSIPCIIWTKLAQPAAATAETPFWTRPLIAADALAFYLYKLIWPAKLGIDYGRMPQRVIDSGWILYTWLAPAAVAIVIALLWRRTRVPAAGALIFVAILAPVLGLVPFDFQMYSTVADHYLYLAMLGVALLAAWAIAQKRIVAVLAFIILAVLGVRSVMQTLHWRDSQSLFTHAIDVNPNSFAAYNSLAAAALDKQQLLEAVEFSDKAIHLNPKHYLAYVTFANALRQSHQTTAAITNYRKALDLQSDYAPALANLAAALAEQDKLDEAIPLAERAVAFDPDSVINHMNLATMYLKSNRPGPASRELNAVLRLDPDNPVARRLLSLLPPASTGSP